jgi:phosphonopyruvate decarboxylase
MTAGMPLVETLRVVHRLRAADDVVISTMGAAREWMALGTGPLDWIFVPSSMGQATSLGLGLALARPDRRIIVLNGDGSMLMNQGSLVTIAACAPENLVILLLDNGSYEITGAQPTPGAAAGRARGDAVDFAGLARASGLEAVFRFAALTEWTSEAAAVLATRGPVFAVLEVAVVAGAKGPRSPGPAPERAQAFKAALAVRKG